MHAIAIIILSLWMSIHHTGGDPCINVQCIEIFYTARQSIVSTFWGQISQSRIRSSPSTRELNRSTPASKVTIWPICCDNLESVQGRIKVTVTLLTYWKVFDPDQNWRSWVTLNDIHWHSLCISSHNMAVFWAKCIKVSEATLILSVTRMQPGKFNYGSAGFTGDDVQ